MQEIVINTCYGGFGLSFDALKAYYILKGKEIYSYYPYDTSDAINWKYKKTDDGAKDDSMLVLYTTIDCGEFFSQSDAVWQNLGDNQVDDYKIKRDDPDLIAVIKNLKDKANGDCANLKIVEVPDDVKWKIEDYNGAEHIAEQHRTWH
jgi:hypothetical protein